MRAIDIDQIFTRHLEPHREEVSEWGAFAGLHGQQPIEGEQRVRTLAATALTRAGFGWPARLAYSEERLKEVEAAQCAIAGRLSAAYDRLTGARAFTSASYYRKVVEGAIDLVALPVLPPVLVLVWLVGAVQRWSTARLAHKEGALGHLSSASAEYLLKDFRWHFEKGAEARRLRLTRPTPARPSNIQTNQESIHEDHTATFQ